MGRPDTIIPSKHGCPQCSNRYKFTNHDIDIKLKGRNILRVGDYIKDKVKIDFKCLVCSHIWKSRADVIISGYGCPSCQASNMEKRLKNIIESNIKYDYYEYHKCIRSSERRFIVDFFIKKNSKDYIVEYNGRQHYSPVSFWGGLENFQRQIKRDNDLRKLCLEKNITLIELDGRKSPVDIEENLMKIFGGDNNV
jgi:predicted  nucleic acid-binding Zn-ribbon protein